MIFVGPGTRLSPQDWLDAAKLLKVSEAHIRAVCEVEAAGSGFDGQRRPRILFEPHKFYAALKANKVLQKRAVALGLAYPKWGARPYPKTSDGNYERLEDACAIDLKAGLSSASWGLGQIMGGNYKAAGFPDVASMVTAFVESERNQLLGMAHWIVANGLDAPLRAQDWAKFARGYNGAGYAKNAYDVKLARAFKKWSKASTARTIPVASSDLIVGSKGSKVEALQKRLVELRYQVKVDGGYGNLTRDAVMAFQKDNGLEPTGVTDDETWAKLDTAEPRELPAAREEATMDDLRAEGSKIVTRADSGSALGKVLVGGGVLTQVSDLLPSFDVSGSLSFLSGLIEPLKALKEFAHDNWGILIIVAGGYAWYKFRQIQNARLEDKRTGKTI